MIRRLLALVAAAAVVATPVAAQASRAAAPAPAAARAGAPMEDANQVRGGFILPLIIIVALILGILKLTDTWPFEEDPESP